MRELQLSKNKITVVDDEDYELLIKFSWYATYNGGRFYAVRRYNRRPLYMHRYIMNPPIDFVVDHVDRNTLNNQRNNLRICCHSLNSANKTVNNPAGFRGIFYRKDRGYYQAAISINNKRVVLGNATTPEGAARLYDKAAYNRHRDLGILNYPEEYSGA